MLETFSFTERMLSRVKQPWLDWLIPRSILRWAIFRSRSPLVRAQRAAPGGWEAMELVYANATPVDRIDAISLRGNAYARAARNRRRVVVTNLRRLVEQYPVAQPLILVNLGSGTGTHVRDLLADPGLQSRAVTAFLLDQNEKALRRGRQLAQAAGVAELLQFVAGDARRFRSLLKIPRADIVEVVGLIEYLNDQELRALLRDIFDLLPAGGAVLVNAMTDAHGGARLFERVFGLRMTMRGPQRMSALLVESGFVVVHCDTEPMDIHSLLTARKPAF